MTTTRTPALGGETKASPARDEGERTNDYAGLIERLDGLSHLEPGWYANVGKQTGERCCAAMREAAEAVFSEECHKRRCLEPTHITVTPVPEETAP